MKRSEVEKKEFYGVAESFYCNKMKIKSFCVKRRKIFFYYLDFQQKSVLGATIYNIRKFALEIQEIITMCVFAGCLYIVKY